MPHWYQPAPQTTAKAEAPEAEAPEAEAAPAETADPTLAPATDTSAPRRPLVLLVLGAVTVLLGGFGIWATAHASSLRSQAAQQNAAVIDPAATTAVQRQIDSAVQTIFSYSYADTAATRQAAQRLLTGQAIQQYDSLFALVEREAPTEKLVVTTTVTNSGVELLTGGQARVLLFVNQQDTRAGTKQTTYGGAMLAVTAIFQAGRWKIENIDTFS
jgi:Mce-associated membrane protein